MAGIGSTKTILSISTPPLVTLVESGTGSFAQRVGAGDASPSSTAAQSSPVVIVIGWPTRLSAKAPGAAQHVALNALGKY